MKTQFEHIEQQEIIKKLRDHGFSQMIDVFFKNEDKIHTKKSRLNKSGTCRVFGWKPKQLEDALKECRKIIESDFKD